MKNNMIFIIIILFITLGFSFVMCNSFNNTLNPNFANIEYPINDERNEEDIKNRIIAVVNDKVITAKELEREISNYKIRNFNSRFNQNKLTIEKQSIENLIYQQILLQLGSERNIIISNQQVDEAIKDIAMKNNFTMASLILNVEASGIPFRMYKKQIYNKLIINQLQQEIITNQIHVSFEEIENYIKKNIIELNRDINPSKIYTLRNLVIELPESHNARTVIIASYNKMATDINNGVLDFEEIARKFSQASNANNGGILGHSIRFESIHPIYINKVEKLVKNEVSKPFLVGNTLHMIYVDKIEEDKPLIDTNIVKYYVYSLAVKIDSKIDDATAINILNKVKLATESEHQLIFLAEKYNQMYYDINDELGWISIIDKPFDFPMLAFSKLKSLKQDEFSEAFKVDSKTWMIVKYTKRKMYNAIKEFKQQKALEAIYSEKAKKIYKTWMNSIKNNVYIDILELN